MVEHLRKDRFWILAEILIADEKRGTIKISAEPELPGEKSMQPCPIAGPAPHFLAALPKTHNVAGKANIDGGAVRPKFKMPDTAQMLAGLVIACKSSGKMRMLAHQ